MRSFFDRRFRRFGMLVGLLVAISINAALAAPPPEDITPPTTPQNFGAYAISTTEMNLGWTYSTDNRGVAGYSIHRCLGAGCSNWTWIANATGTSYIDSGLSPSTTYTYVIFAYDAAGNSSNLSNTYSATTFAPPDTEAPSAPSGMSAVAASSSQINVNWNAASDNVGVWYYEVEQCGGAGCSNFSQVTTTSGLSYVSTGLSSVTSYSFRVRAIDSAGNIGPYSVASAVTLDSQAPTAPSALATSVVSSTQINLIWGASSDNVGVTNYLVERCSGAGCSNFAQIGTSSSTSYSSTGLTGSTSYSYRVRAIDAAGNASGYSNTASGTTQAPPDTTAPTAPTGLAASVVSSTQINLTWTASTDAVGVTGYRVERCSGAGCTTFAQVASPTSTSFNDTGLTASTTYRYQVRATDAAGNLSAYSTIVSAATQAPPDTTAPTVPTGLTTSVISSTQINLSWTAATDAVGVTGYRVERCSGASCTTFAQVSAPTTTSYNDTGLTASTTYRYQVRATDAAGNLGPYTSPVSATTQAPPDTVPPTAPSGLTAIVVSTTQINLSWTAAMDATGVTGYRVERCSGASCTTFAQVGTPTATSFNDTGLTASTTYRYQVRATDAAGNLGPYTSIVNATTQTPDTTAPTAPSGLTSSVISGTQINLSWTASTDAVGVTGYRVERCSGASCTTFAQISTPTGTSYNDTGLTTSTTYRYQVRATDAAGNLSAYSNIVTATTTTPDTTPPTAPTGLALSVISTTQINLSWTAATDAVGVTGYRVERCTGASCTTFAQVGTPTTTSFNNTGLTASTTYRYRVRAADAAGNLGPYSSIVTATTQTPDTTAPTAPTGLTASVASSTQINLTWTAATDAVGVTGYRVERCSGSGCTSFAQVGTPTATSYNNTGLTGATIYRFRVRATDAAGNLGPYSSVVTATTQTPPAAPTALNLTAASATEIDIAWTASTSSGVTGYVIERCQGSGCSTFAVLGSSTSNLYLFDTALPVATSFSYRIRTVNSQGNQSSPSSVLTVTTLATSTCD